MGTSYGTGRLGFSNGFTEVGFISVASAVFQFNLTGKFRAPGSGLSAAIFDGAASQIENIAVFRNSVGTTLSAIDANGKLVASAWRPEADSTTAMQMQNAAGTAIVTVDTTNSRLGIGTTPGNKLDVAGTVQMDGLRIDVAPVSETVTCTHTLTFSANGTNYKFPCVVA
jgi:hypothetical protein